MFFKKRCIFKTHTNTIRNIIIFISWKINIYMLKKKLIKKVWLFIGLLFFIRWLGSFAILILKLCYLIKFILQKIYKNPHEITIYLLTYYFH
jgi:hypothetical protein